MASGPDADETTVLVQRDCVDGSKIVDLRLGRPVCRADLERIAGRGELHVRDELPRAFFRLDVPDEYTLTGIFEDARVRFKVRRPARDRAVEVALETARRMLGGASG